ncbi:MAG: hypothetical protein NTV46_07125 [Verrucomicrobia bacterium]|nr:hypothetical protein [Verrucomicrobiota bacterium]
MVTIRALITQLTADLSTARYHKDGILEKSSALWPVDRLGFLTLQPARAQSDAGRIGDLCAVHYYIHDLTIGGKTVRCLMRGFRESLTTFKALENEHVAALFTQQIPIDEPVVFGVVAFQAKPMTRDATGKWIDWVPHDNTGPEALDICLVMARRNLAGKLTLPADWDGAGSTARLLGRPSEAVRNANLEVYATLLRFGNHDHP